MPTTQEVLQDPNFQSLPTEEKRKVLLKIDDNFRGLPDVEQTKVISRLGKPSTEKGTTPSPWMRGFVKPTLEYGGLAVGAAAGTAAALSATGPLAPYVGGVPGAGVGFASGAKAYRGLESMLYGTPQEESLGKTTKEMGIGGLTEMGGQIVGGILAPGLSWLINKLPGVATGIKASFQKVVQIAKQENIKLPLPVQTGSSVHAGIYKTAANMPTSEGTIAKEVGESLKQVEEFSQRTIKGKGLDVTPKMAGDVAQTGESIAYQKAHEQGQKLYKVATNLGKSKNVEINLKELRETGEKILKSDEFDLLPSDLQEAIKNVIKKTIKEVPAEEGLIYTPGGQKAISIPTTKIDVKRSLEQVDELRKALSAEAGHGKFYKNNAERLFNQLGEGLDKDVVRDTKSFAAVQKAWLKAREFQYKEIFGKFKGLTSEKQIAMGEKLLGSDPSTLLKNADTVGGLSQIEKVMPPPYYDVVRRGKIAESLKFKTILTESGEVRLIDGDALRKTIYEGMTPEYRAKLFKPDELNALDRLIEITRAFSRVEKLGGSQSGTPKGIWYGKLMAGEVSGAVGGGIVGGSIGAGVGMTVSLLGPYGVAKFITSDSGKRLLIEGVKLGTKTKVAGKILGYGGIALGREEARE